MAELTPNAQQSVQQLSLRYGVSEDAVRTLLSAVSAGGGTMAQFYHPELGGGGQWMAGGMTMVGDMFNNGLKNTVANLCGELSALLSQGNVFAPVPAASGWSPGGSSSWWPAELGSPSSSGGQNDSRYAVFPGTRRLAVDRGGAVSVYDTLDHNIGGVQQQQGGASGSLSFSSQFGTFTVDSLPLLSGQAPQPQFQQPQFQQPQFQQPQFQQPQFQQPQFVQEPQYVQPPVQQPQFTPSYESPPQQPFDGGGQPAAVGAAAILDAVERLASLHRAGVLTDDELRTKKAELLARL